MTEYKKQFIEFIAASEFIDVATNQQRLILLVVEYE